MSIKINNDNYDMYKGVFSIISGRWWKYINELMQLPESSDPILILEQMELKSKTIAKKGLQAGLNDVLSDLREYPKEILADIDVELKKQGFPDLSILSGVVEKSIKKVLRAKKIGNIDQYYMIKEVLDDLDYNINEEDKQLLSKYFSDFEMKATRNLG